jgi:cobalt/nickel transport protein
MNKFTKKIFLGLIILAILSPLGLFLPEKFRAGDAWGEWSIETIKKDLGFVPTGMEKNANIWKAPLPDYGSRDGKNTILINSGYYMLSGLIAMVLIIIITIVLLKIVQKRELRRENGLGHDNKSPRKLDARSSNNEFI